MVRIASNGDIIQDDDPRATQRSEPPREPRFATTNTDSGGGNFGNAGNYQQGTQSVPILIYANQRLIQMGVPRINVTETFAIEPLILVAAILSFFLLGPSGLIFTGLMWVMFSVQNGQMGGQGIGGAAFRPGPGGPGNSGGPGRPGGPGQRGRWQGQGHTLGRR